MNEQYRKVTMQTAVKGFRLAGAFEDARSKKPIYIDGPVIRALEDNPDINEQQLRDYLNQFGKQAFKTRIAPYVLSLIRKRTSS